jgi:hypothetical protein
LVLNLNSQFIADWADVLEKYARVVFYILKVKCVCCFV